MNKKRRKSRKQRRLLLTSLMLALIIVIGGTFAWFTSKDEVTNRLTSQGNMSVVATENFTPTDTWAKGQTVEKDLYLLNTGNMDALARVALSNAISLTKYDDSVSATSANKKFSITPEDSDIKCSSTTDSKGGVEQTEAIAMQAGGQMVVQAGTVLDSAVEINSGELATTLLTSSNTGVYIFDRVINQTTAGTTTETTHQYSGYYYDSTNYYKLQNITKNLESGEYTVNTVKKTDFASDATGWSTEYSSVSSDSTSITATLTHKTGNDVDAEVTVQINLGTGWSSYYDYIPSGTEALGKFYYKKVLESGKKSGVQLIDSVQLVSVTDGTNDIAYENLTYDLTAVVDSVQAVYSEDGTKLQLDAAKSEWKVNDNVGGDTVTKTGGAFTISWKSAA